MESWICSHCGEGIYGSLQVVLILASKHKCRSRLDRSTATTCLACLRSPTGLCAYHAAWLASLKGPDTTGLFPN